MKISLDEARQIAELARLELTPDELGRVAGELDKILVHIAQLEEVNVAGVEPMTHAVALPARLRLDDRTGELSHDDATRGAPALEAGSFVVPKVIEAGS